jgi:hypothetical protein
MLGLTDFYRAFPARHFRWATFKWSGSGKARCIAERNLSGEGPRALRRIPPGRAGTTITRLGLRNGLFGSGSAGLGE